MLGATKNISCIFFRIFNFPSLYFQKSPKPQLWKRILYVVHKILKKIFWYFVAKLLHSEHDKTKCLIFLKNSLLMSWMKLLANTFDLPEIPLFQWKYCVSKRIHWSLFAVLSTSKSLCFLCFYLGWWDPETNWNAPDIHFNIKVSVKQDKIFSSFFTWMINWMKVTPFHSLCQGLWDAYFHLSKGKGCCLHSASTFMTENKDRHKLQSYGLIPVNKNFA